MQSGAGTPSGTAFIICLGFLCIEWIGCGGKAFTIFGSCQRQQTLAFVDLDLVPQSIAIYCILISHTVKFISVLHFFVFECHVTRNNSIKLTCTRQGKEMQVYCAWD